MKPLVFFNEDDKSPILINFNLVEAFTKSYSRIKNVEYFGIVFSYTNRDIEIRYINKNKRDVVYSKIEELYFVKFDDIFEINDDGTLCINKDI
jgi:hypothetical protein